MTQISSLLVEDVKSCSMSRCKSSSFPKGESQLAKAHIEMMSDPWSQRAESWLIRLSDASLIQKPVQSVEGLPSSPAGIRSGSFVLLR